MKENIYSPLLFTMILMFLESMSCILAGDPPEEITKGKHIEKQIAPNETHRYFVSLKKEKFLLEVKPLDWNGKPGKYRLSIIKLEPRAKSPEGQVDQLFASLDLEDSPGVAIGVVKKGEIIYQKGYGKANLEYNIPITPSTVFHMASISKQFTAFSIALLAENGELSVSDDVRKYIPELPDFGKPITLEHLLHHTSGLRDQWNLLAIAGWRLDDVISREQILKLIVNQKELNFDPGAEFLYCNTGYTLLAEVVSRVSEMTFAEWTAENIFKPLGMDHTLFYDDH